MTSLPIDIGKEDLGQLTLSTNPYLPEIEAERRLKPYAVVNPPMVLASMRALMELDYLNRPIGSENQNNYLFAATDFLISQGFLTEISLDGGILMFTLTSKGEEYIKDEAIIDIMHDTYTDIMVAVEEIAGLNREVDGEAYSLKTSMDFEGEIDQRNLDAWIVPALSLLELLKDSEGRTIKDVLLSDLTFDINDIKFPNQKAKEECQAFFEILFIAGIVTRNGDQYSIDSKTRRIIRLSGYALLALSYYQTMQQLDQLILGKKEYGLGKDLYRQAEMNAIASNADMALAVGPALTRILNGAQEFDGFEDELNPSTVIDYGSGGGEVLMRFVDGVDGIDQAYGLDFNPRTVAAARGIIAERGHADSITCLQGSIIDEDSMQALRDKIEADGHEPGIANICAILHDIGFAASRDFLHLHAKVFGDTPLIITEALRVPLEVKTAYPDYRPTSFDFMHDISGQELFTQAELLALLTECGYTVRGTKVYSSIDDGQGGRQPVGVSYLVQFTG